MRDARGCGLIINHIISALATKRPRAFILENVKGLVTQHKATFNMIFAATAPHGRVRLQSWIQNHGHGRLWHPTASRARLHRGFAPGRHGPWVLIHLAYPAASHTAGHSARLAGKTDKREARKRETRFLAHATPKLRQRLRQALHNIRQKGVDPKRTDQLVVVDIDGSKPHWMLGMSPCLTRARASTGHYLPALGRRLTIPERLRFQALPVDIHARCEGNISDRQLGAMNGISLSLNVVGAIVTQMLVACGLLEAGERS
jgi:site-specific DNA-cytosine methylase